MSWTIITFGALGVLIVTLIIKKLRKVSSIAALVGSLGIATGGTGGLISHWINSGAGLFTTGSSKVELIAFGAALPGLVVLALLGLVLHDLWPKNKAKFRTVVLAFLVPLLGVAAGGAVGHAFTQAKTSIVQTTATSTGK